MLKKFFSLSKCLFILKLWNWNLVGFLSVCHLIFVFPSYERWCCIAITVSVRLSVRLTHIFVKLFSETIYRNDFILHQESADYYIDTLFLYVDTLIFSNIRLNQLH